MSTTIAIADDQYRGAESLLPLIDRFAEFDILFVAGNGRDFLSLLRSGSVAPDVALLNLTTSGTDNLDTARQLCRDYPAMRIVAILRPDCQEPMVRWGASAGLPKNGVGIGSRQLRPEVRQEPRFGVGGHLPRIGASVLFTLKRREYEFLKLACSELTYYEIADQMCVSPRTVDGYREAVFEKMGVRTRTGMVLGAIQQGLIEP